MNGGKKKTWVEVETEMTNTFNKNPASGRQSGTARTLSGNESLRVGKVNKKIAKQRGTF